jgi:hypothetical protein
MVGHTGVLTAAGDPKLLKPSMRLFNGIADAF